MIPPVTQETFDNLSKKWATTINTPGTFSIDVWYPISGAQMRVKQFLLDKKQQTNYITNSNPKFAYIDLADSQTILKKDLEEQLSFSLQVEGSLEEWLKKNPSLRLFILGLDTSLKNNNLETVAYLQQLTTKYLFSSIVITELSIFENLYPLTYQPLYTQQDCIQFYSYLEEKWHLTIPSALPQKLAEMFGGHFLLIKEAARLIMAKPTISLNEIITAPSLIQKGKAIFQRLTPKDQQIILQVLQGIATSPSEYLEKTHLISCGKAGIPYWEVIRGELIHAVSQKTNFDFLLTAPEREIFELLSENNNIVSRDSIAKTLWQQDWEEKYSDWAIDKLIQRIRDKIEKTRVPFELVTKKGEGFYLKK